MAEAAAAAAAEGLEELPLAPEVLDPGLQEGLEPEQLVLDPAALPPQPELLALEYYPEPEDPPEELPEELEEDITDIDERLDKQRRLRTHFKEHPNVTDTDSDHSSNEELPKTRLRRRGLVDKDYLVPQMMMYYTPFTRERLVLGPLELQRNFRATHTHVDTKLHDKSTKPMDSHQLHQMFDTLVKLGRYVAHGSVPDCTTFKTVDLDYKPYYTFNNKNYFTLLDPEKIHDIYLSDHWDSYYSEYDMGLEHELVTTFKNSGYFFKYNMTLPTNTG